jgi:hypothetical protein
MRALFFAMAVAAVLALIHAGCQAYEFEPVESKAIETKTDTVPIVGQKKPPYVMLVVDQSGSMKTGALGGGQNCTTDGTPNGAYDPNTLDSVSCKWNELRKTFTDPTNGFLKENGSVANWGLILFSSDGHCAAGNIEAGVGSNVNDIIAKINGAMPNGGTPTAGSLKRVLDDPKMKVAEAGRDRLVMLLTDGAPNCNPDNAPLCSQCKATPSTCSTGCRPTFPCDTEFNGAGCLDEAGVVGQVTALANANIRTFVIGFGAETQDPGSDAYKVLDKAAVAGGLARGTEPKFYQANSAAELKKALEDLIKVINTCHYSLTPAPLSEAVVQVVFIHNDDGNREEVLARGVDWHYDAGSASVTLEEPRCREVNSAAPNTLTVEFRYLNVME